MMPTPRASTKREPAALGQVRESALAMLREGKAELGAAGTPFSRSAREQLTVTGYATSSSARDLATARRRR